MHIIIVNVIENCYCDLLLNRAKFNETNNVISSPFVCGTISIHQKTWWHSVIDFDSLLNSMV